MGGRHPEVIGQLAIHSLKRYSGEKVRLKYRFCLLPWNVQMNKHTTVIDLISVQPFPYAGELHAQRQHFDGGL